jgi:WD40 repeat protein
VFAVPSGRYLRSFQIHFADPDGGRVIAVPWRFDPNGRLLFGGYDTGPHATNGPFSIGPNDKGVENQRIAVVDPHTGRILAQAGLGDVTAASVSEWSRDGRMLAVGTIDGTVTVYNAATLAVVARGGALEPGFVRTASFSPDGHTLITSGTSGTVSFLNLPSLDRIAQPLRVDSTSDTGGVYAWYAPNGHVVGFAQDSAHLSSPLQRWFDLPAQPAELSRAACGLAGGDMTRAAWRRYVPHQPYRHVCA